MAGNIGSNNKCYEEIDFPPQIRMSVAPDNRKRMVSRPFRMVSARIGGTVSALHSTRSSPPLPLSPESSFRMKRSGDGAASSARFIQSSCGERSPRERTSGIWTTS